MPNVTVEMTFFIGQLSLLDLKMKYGIFFSNFTRCRMAKLSRDKLKSFITCNSSASECIKI
jgi:hypothetical protein